VIRNAHRSLLVLLLVTVTTTVIFAGRAKELTLKLDFVPQETIGEHNPSTTAAAALSPISLDFKDGGVIPISKS